MLQLPLLCALLTALPAIRAALPPTRGIYDDDSSALQLSLEDLEREEEQAQAQHHQHQHHFDLNRPPLLPTHYAWHPSIAASVPPSYVRDAAQLEQEAERQRQLQLQQLQQLQQQHQQLSAGYALPAQIPAGLLLYGGPPDASPTPATVTTTTAAAIKSGQRLLQPIVAYDDLDLQLNGVQYLSGNALPQPLPRPVPRPLRPPYTFVQQRTNPSSAPAAIPLVLQQSKQFAYAPLPQRAYAAAPRIPLPYPPSFISITTRRPTGSGSGSGSGYASSYGKPFRPSQPDPTPDLFAGRESKSLLDSYIPSWEVLRLQQQHRHNQQQHQHQQPRAVQRHTLAYSVPGLRLFKRDSMQQAAPERSRIVKKSLPQDAGKEKLN